MDINTFWYNRVWIWVYGTSLSTIFQLYLGGWN